MSRTRRRNGAIAFILGSALASPVGAATIVDSTRFVLASTFSAVPPSFLDDDSAGQSQNALGRWIDAAVASAGLTDISNANAEALQDTTVANAGGVARVSGSASVGASFDVFDPGFPSRAVGNGETGLSVILTVDEASDYRLGLALRADLDQLDVFASPRPVDTRVLVTALLVGASTGVVFERRLVDDLANMETESDTLSLFGTLAPDTYLLELAARVELQGFEDSVGFATAGFGVDFVVVPEPGPGGLTLAGLMAVSLMRGWRRGWDSNPRGA